jgi:hypothetical protein
MRSGFRINVRGTGAGGGIFSRVVGSLFFLVFGGIGLVFLVLLSRESGKNLRTWFWKSTPCEILASSIAENRDGRRNQPYRLEISFRYEFNGREHTTQHAAEFGKYRDATRLLQRFPVEGKAVCFVNPSAPDEAVLKRGNLWILPFLCIPLVFVCVAVGGIYYLWRRRPTGATAGAQAPISDRVNPARGGLILGLFFSVFLVMGLLFLWMMFLKPALQIWQARAWPATPCRVISSEVRTHSDSDGSTYSVEILYEYEVDGRVYRSDRYRFLSGSSSGRAAKAAIVARFPPAKQAICYVNPGDPNDAVIERGFTGEMWFGLIPLVFVAVGLGGVGFAVRAWLNKSGTSIPSRSRVAVRLATTPALAVPTTIPEGSRTLKPTLPPLGRLIVALLVAAFWNGIVSVFVVHAVRGFERGRPEWFLTLFLIPFVLIGLGMIGWVGYSALALFNPRPTVQLTPGELRLGEPFAVAWQFTGRMGALERVTLELEGREEATYRRGTSTSTDKSVFARITIVESTTRDAMQRGEAKALVPGSTMHSFQAPNNKVVWNLRVHGHVPRWPDVKEEFPVTVHPAAAKPEVPT